MPRKRKDMSTIADNEAASYRICRNLSDIFGFRISTSSELIKLLNGAALHTVAEACLENTTGMLDKAKIELPYIGTLFVSYKDGDIVVDNIVLDSKYKADVVAAMRNGESPLLNRSEDKLLNKLRSRYDSLV